MKDYKQHRIDKKRNSDLNGKYFPLKYGFNYALWVYEPIEYNQTPVSHNLSVSGKHKMTDVSQGQE